MPSRPAPRLIAASAAPLAALALVAPAGAADTRLSSQSASVRAIAAAGTDAAVALDTGRGDRPFLAVRARPGAKPSTLGRFGDPEADTPGIAADAGGRIVVGWDRPVSGGLALFAQPMPSGDVTQIALATGPGLFSLADDGSAVAAFPDRSGDAAVLVAPDIARPSNGRSPYAQPSERPLTSDAPINRHLPLDLELTPRGALVLDLAQRRTRSTLRALGPGAPNAALVSAPGLRTIQGSLAADGDTIAVAYVAKGRVILATARPGGAWRRRTLPGSSPAEGAPAVVLDRGRPVVVWTRRVTRSSRDLYAFRAGKVRRLTRTRGDESAPVAVARPGGGVFVAWTGRSGARRIPLLRRLG